MRGKFGRKKAAQALFSGSMSSARIGTMNWSAGMGSVNPSRVAPRPMDLSSLRGMNWSGGGIGVSGAGPAQIVRKSRVNPAIRRMNRVMAGKGKFAAGAVAAGLGLNAISRRSGAGADKPVGRPTGMYQY